MSVGFSGEVAQLYDDYRRGYPDAVVDAIVDAFGLTDGDIGVDLGCGTGQLTLGLAGRLRAVVGVDPEPDMLSIARRRAEEQGVGNVAWILGTDEDLPSVAQVVGPRVTGVVTAATALHWMRDEELFRSVARIVRPGGGFAVVTNGKPLWQLDLPWSRRLRVFLEAWTGEAESYGCGTDDAAQQRYQDNLASAGLTVWQGSVDYTDDLSLEGLTGAMLSAFSVQLLPVGPERDRFAAGIRDALGAGPFTEPVHVGLIFGRHDGPPNSTRVGYASV